MTEPWPARLVLALQGLPPEAVWALLLLACFGAVLTLARLFGAAGLYVYVAVALIGANVQVLKPVAFAVFPDPVALGTVLFATTYLCTDILAEHYGPAAARRAVWLGFAAFVLWTALMLLTLGFRPLGGAEAETAGLAWTVPVQRALETLYLPAPALLFAGMIAYLLSQHHDVWLFALLKRLTGGRWLWLRNNASTALSGLIDNIVFSVMAWVVLAPEPLGWQPLIVTYILGTYVLRLVVAALDTPVIYLARHLLRPGRPGARKQGRRACSRR